MYLYYIFNTDLLSRKANVQMVLKTCEAISKTGGKVRLVVPYVSQADKGALMQFYGIKNGFPITALPVFRPTFQGIRRRINYLLFPLLSLILTLLTRPNVVYVRDPGVLYLVAILKKKFPRLFSGMLLVGEIHELVYELYPEDMQREQKKKEVFAYEQVEKIVAMTENLKRAIVNLGIPSEKILVAHDGVDLSAYKPMDKEKARKELGIPLEKKIIVYTGHLYDWKGVYVLAEAMKYLDNALLYVVGGLEEDIKRFEDFIKSRNISNINIVGFVSPTIVPKYTAIADVVVLPNTSKLNVSKYYVSPLKLFEYMASKRPIVASDLPNLREILRDGENAVLVEPDNPQSLADGIKKVLDNDELANKIVEKAYHDVQEYTWDKRAERVMEFLGR